MATEKNREGIKTALHNNLICLEAYAATRLDRSFLGINVQLIAQGKLQLKVLMLLELNNPHSVELITSTMTITLQNFDMNMSHVLALTTNNGMNMACCSKLINRKKLLNSMIQSDVEVDDDSDPEEGEAAYGVNEVHCPYSPVEHIGCSEGRLL